MARIDSQPDDGPYEVFGNMNRIEVGEEVISTMPKINGQGV